MTRTSLKGFSVKEVSAINNKKNSEKISLENKYNYNMRTINETVCIGEFKVTVCDKENPESFSVSAVCSGVFEHSKEKSATELHIESMEEIFPFVKAFISTLTTNMGIAPIILPTIDYGNMSIVNLQIPPKP